MQHDETPAPGEAAAPGETPPSPAAPEEEILLLKEQLALEADRRLRAMAEAENLKKRLIKEKEEFLKYAAEGVVSELLPVLDNLDLALTHGRGNEACRDLFTGVDMTRKAFMDVLSRHGVEEFGTEGEPFSPEIHEALSMESRDDLPPDAVSRVIQKGYRLRGRLLRPAKVLVTPSGS